MTSDDEHNSSFDLREAERGHHLNTHEVLGTHEDWERRMCMPVGE